MAFKKKAPKKPSTQFDALSVRTYEKNGEEKNAWMRCGVAFINDDGTGGKILLQTVPAANNGEVTILIRPPFDEDAERPHKAKAKKRDEQEEESDDLPF